MLVNGCSLPELSKLGDVEWSDELVWETADSQYILMNACDHGAAPKKSDWLDVDLVPGKYAVQRGQYGWASSDPALVLFRFNPMARGSQEPQDFATAVRTGP